MGQRFHGIFTPLITPITDHQSPDLRSLERLVEYQVAAGVHGLWVMGTTAEFAAFDEDERAALVETVVTCACGRVPVIANVSDASTRLAVRHARRALAAGVDAIAATPPYYYPHSQDEVLAHYREVRAAVDAELFVYNIPQTVRVRVELPTACTLAAEGTVAGIKDSQNDLEWFRQLTLFVRRHGLDFAAFAGTRSLIDAAVLAGAAGAIPSLANAFPSPCVAAYEAAVSGDLAAAADGEAEIIGLESVAAAATEGSRNAAILGFIKAVLCHRGIISNGALTRPLRTPTGEEQALMMSRIQETGLDGRGAPAMLRER